MSYTQQTFGKISLHNTQINAHCNAVWSFHLKMTEGNNYLRVALSWKTLKPIVESQIKAAGQPIDMCCMQTSKSL